MRAQVKLECVGFGGLSVIDHRPCDNQTVEEESELSTSSVSATTLRAFKRVPCIHLVLWSQLLALNAIGCSVINIDGNPETANFTGHSCRKKIWHATKHEWVLGVGVGESSRWRRCGIGQDIIFEIDFLSKGNLLGWCCSAHLREP